MERRETLAKCFDDLELEGLMVVPPLSFSKERWKSKCDVVEAIMGELHRHLRLISELPERMVDVPLYIRVKRTLALMIDTIMTRGHQLKEQPDIQALHAKAKAENLAYL